MSQEVEDIIAMVRRTAEVAEAVHMMYKQQMEAAETLTIQLLLSNGGSLPLRDSLWEEAASGIWQLHGNNGKLWLERGDGK